jgi:membrane-anchored protein YejM (alkaline phosphatase superfamily)
MLSTMFTLGIYVAGFFSSDIREIGMVTYNPAMQATARAISYLLPNFRNFNVISAAAHGDAIPFTLIWQNTVYAALYVALVLMAASAVFSGRNLK